VSQGAPLRSGQPQRHPCQFMFARGLSQFTRLSEVHTQVRIYHSRRYKQAFRILDVGLVRQPISVDGRQNQLKRVHTAKIGPASQL